MNIKDKITGTFGRTGAVAIAVLSIFLLTTAEDCDGDEAKPQSSAQRQEANTRKSNLEGLVAGQPAKKMQFSPSRATVNFWLDTWDEPGKLSYVYLRAANGQLIGYYVLEGLPVSYCVGITQPFDIINVDGVDGDQDIAVPAPAMDGVYYGGCNDRAYYGKDATTGAYIEYTIGEGQSVFLYDQPLDIDDAQPLGYTVVTDGAISEGTPEAPPTESVPPAP